MDSGFDNLTAALADRYQIEREIGQGGMATVYLAKDLKHERQVAVKVLRPELAAAIGAERFLAEIKTTANLQHPHIVPLFDSGEAGGFLYYVMPYIEGASLRDRLDDEQQLPIDEALEIARVVGSALDFAHARDVVHRDIKPENILFQDGVASVADFGIALAANSTGGDRLTEAGVSLGTPAYMSPEQIAGERDLDHRSDVYSLACVTYEMLAGDPPFVASRPLAIFAKHMTDLAPPVTTARPGVSPTAAAALAKALSKAAADRPKSAGAFAEALRSGDAPSHAAPPSIVVLPFANLSADADNEYFSDGLTDEIITDLSAVQALRVISSSSARMLKETTKSVRQIGAELSCGYALEGAVRRSGDSIRITAKLVEVDTDTQLWTGKYGGTLDDVFEIQESVSREIVDALQVRLSPKEEEAIAARPIEDVRAQECYLKARTALWSFIPEGLEEGVRQLKKGLEIVGNNVTLQRGLAEAYLQYINMALAGGREEHFVDLIEQCAQRIFELEPDSPHGLHALSCVQGVRGQTQETVRLNTRVLDMLPRDTSALLFCGHGLSWHLGRPDLAAPFAERLREIDPLTPISRIPSVSAPLFSGDFEAALDAAREMRELDPSLPISKAMVVMSLLHLERFEEAEELCADVKAAPDSDLGTWWMGIYRAMWRGEVDEVRRLCAGPYAQLADWDQEVPHTIAQAYASIGDVPQALAWFEKTIDQGMINYPYFSRYDPFLANLRGNERFEELLER
ncbi:MAG: protein kinase, partial [Gemmatimonadota bacterium]